MTETKVGASAASRRDPLVQQLLEERRHRLQQKLFANASEEPVRPSPERCSRLGRPEIDRTPVCVTEQIEHVEPQDDGFLTSVLARLRAAEKAEQHDQLSSQPEQAAPRAIQPFPEAEMQVPRETKPKACSQPPGRVGQKKRKPTKASQSKSPAPRRRSSSERFDHRLQKWQLQHQASREKQMQAKQEKDIEELEECTFQPSINSRSEFYARRSRGCLAEALPERLYHEADRRANLRNKAKEIMEADALCSCTFQPKINRKSTGSVGQRAPLHLRLDTLSKQREERARSAHLAEEKRSEHFFQPRISCRSERLVQRKRDMLYKSASHGQVECLRQLGPVEERLYAEAKEKEQRLAALQDVHAEELRSFPSVDDTSKQICKASVYFQGPQQDFLTRQQTFELAKQKRMDVRAQHLETECSFQPRITETSRQLVCNNVELLGETPEERIHRLAVRDAERREQTRQELEQLHHKDYTFKPEINPVSQALAASRLEDGVAASPHERLYRSALSKSRHDSGHSDDSSFRPQLDRRSSRRFAHVKSRYARPDLMESIRQEQEKKAEYLLERRRELEEERNADCTFTPSVTEGFQDIQKPVAVSGLDRFFELKNLALKKQQEQQEREQRVFRPETISAQGVKGVTVPEPFQLSREA